jgi:hypothetical protein
LNLGALDAGQFQRNMADHNVHIRGIYGTYTHWSRVSMGYLHDVEKCVAAIGSARSTFCARGATADGGLVAGEDGQSSSTTRSGTQ